MNNHLYVEQPSEAGWTFSLDPAQAPMAYAAERRFTTDAKGLPFVDGAVYKLFAYHAQTNTLLSYLLIYYSTPETCLLVPLSDIPDLDRIARRGAVTALVLTMGGIRVRTLETVSSVEYLVGVRSAPDGLNDFVKIAPSSLSIGGGNPTTPVADFALIAHYEPVPVTAADFEIIAHYEPASALAVPGKPLRVAASRSGSSGSDGTLTWQLVDKLETSVEVRTIQTDGSWGNPQALPAKAQSLALPSIGYGITKIYQVRTVNPAGQSPWSDEASLRINTFIWEFTLAGEGQPPIRIATLRAGGSVQLPATNANLGLQIWDRNNATPTREDYDRLALYVILPDGTRLGWEQPDPAAGPSGVPAYIFPRPNGYTLKPGRYTVVGEIWRGAVLIEAQQISVDLVAPQSKPLAPTALRVKRQNGVVQIDWTDNADNENYQRLEVRAGSGAWQTLELMLPNVVHHDSSTLNAADTTYTFRVLAGNTKGESGYSNEATLTPTPPANRPPTMPALPRQTATVGQPFSYALPAIGDPDGDQVTVGATGAGAGIAFNAGSRSFGGQATATGTLTITVTATDPLGASSVGTLLIDLVAQPNRAPVAPSLVDRRGSVGDAIDITLATFTDPDGDALTYNFLHLPTGISQVGTSTRLTGALGAVETNTVLMTATDSRGASTPAQYVWTIGAAAPKAPVAPALPTLTLAADAPYFETFLPAFADPQGQALTYAMRDLPEGLSFDVATRKVSGYAEASGQVGATYSATNTAGLTTSATQLFMISLPTITQVRGRLRSTGGTDWVLEAEVIISQKGLVRYHTDRLRNRSPYFADSMALLGNTTAVIELYSSKSFNPGSGTYAQPPGGSGNYYLHLQIARNPASYAVYGFWLENYYDWAVASRTEPLPPLPQS